MVRGRFPDALIVHKHRPRTGETAMSGTQVLLGKITALRQRLEQAQGLAREADSAAVAL